MKKNARVWSCHHTRADSGSTLRAKMRRSLVITIIFGPRSSTTPTQRRAIFGPKPLQTLGDALHSHAQREDDKRMLC